LGSSLGGSLAESIALIDLRAASNAVPPTIPASVAKAHLLSVFAFSVGDMSSRMGGSPSVVRKCSTSFSPCSEHFNTTRYLTASFMSSGCVSMSRRMRSCLRPDEIKPRFLSISFSLVTLNLRSTSSLRLADSTDTNAPESKKRWIAVSGYSPSISFQSFRSIQL